jgi:GT2 family glycosyltransferase
MTGPELPSFDLVVATVDREHEVDRLLSSLDAQSHRGFRVILVDQNDDDRLERVLAAHPALESVRVRSERGLSRARNAGLEHVTAEVVAFPDDDCVYATDLLERVGARLAGDALDGLSGRVVDAEGRSSPSWKPDPALLEPDNLWNRVNSTAIFLRRRIVEEVGPFDERLGLGCGEPWSSGEEIDYAIRAVRSGARIAYDPGLTVTHAARPPAAREEREIAFRDGASVGYILRKHRYPWRVVSRMLVRPAGGVLASLVRLRRDRARIHAATLRGRIVGLRAKPGGST